MKDEPLTTSDVTAFIEAIWRSLGIEVSLRPDPLDAEIVLEDILDAEEIG